LEVLLHFSPVQSDEGFLPDDVVLMAGQPEEPVQQQGEDGGLSQDVAGSYQAWISGVFCQCFQSGSALKVRYWPAINEQGRGWLQSMGF
jgi:hypothetical protein